VPTTERLNLDYFTDTTKPELMVVRYRWWKSLGNPMSFLYAPNEQFDKAFVQWLDAQERELALAREQYEALKREDDMPIAKLNVELPLISAGAPVVMTSSPNDVQFVRGWDQRQQNAEAELKKDIAEARLKMKNNNVFD